MPIKITNSDFITRARRIHGDKYDYSLCNYQKAIIKMPIICPIHGVFYQDAHHHIMGNGCNSCGNEKMKKILFGIGINDLTGNQNTTQYNVWRKILERCYDNKYHIRKPTYIGCTVCDEWKYFSNFKRWFDNPDNGYKEGYQVDKDIIFKGNKIYSPKTCCFVPQRINCLLVKATARRGELPIGVSFDKKSRKYVSQIVKDGKHYKNGYFDSYEDAFNAYKEAKEKFIKEVADNYYNRGEITKRVYDALYRYRININD